MTTVSGVNSNRSSNVTSSGSSSSTSNVPTAGGTYTVKPGDTLWALAQKVYGDGNRWRDLAEANPQLKDGAIKPGDVVKFPGEVKTDKVAGDPSADAKKVIDDGKPKGDGATPQGDPALQGDLSTLRSLANAGGRGTTSTAGDRGGAASVEDKDVNDEAIQTKADKKVYGNQVAVNAWQSHANGRYVNEGDGWKKDASTEKKKDTDKLAVNATLYQRQISGEASVAKIEGEAKLADGVTAKGNVHALHVAGQGSISGGVDLRNGTIRGDVSGRVEAHLVGAEGSVQAKTALGTTSVKGKAYIGAEASGNARVTIDPRKGTVVASAGVDAFAGAKASLDVNQSLKVGGHEVGSVGAKGEVYAGIGVKANATVGIEKGRVKASFELGAALGVGAGIKVNVDIDVVGTAKAAVDVGKKAVGAVADGAKSLWNGIKSLW